ncbi:MAG: CRISPR-associated protein Csx18 [Coleofasciculaceae cyanobacterium]
MSESVAKKLVRYRSWFVAIINALITWVVLIIAPLGLFAVITCTICVFFGSFVTGWISNLALFSLIKDINPDVMTQNTLDNLSNTSFGRHLYNFLNLSRRRNLPRR